MKTLKLVFTKNFEKTRTEVETAGGRVLHRLGPGIVVVSMPKAYKFSDLKTCSAKAPAKLSEEEKIIVRSWRATHAGKGTRRDSLMSRSTREGIKWDAPNFGRPETNDPERGARATRRASTGRAAKSTGIPTSLYLKDSVAIGVVIVSGENWNKIPGKLKHASVAADGTVWGVNAADNIYRRVGNNWQRVAGKLKQISVGSSTKIWGVNASDNIYRRVGNGWQQVAGKLKHVSVAGDGTVWGVNASNNIYRRVGSGWQQVPGKLKQISAGSSGQVWGVNASDNIYQRLGSQWKKVAGKLKHVSVAKDGSVFGVNASDNIYRRVGNGWKQMPGKLKQISTGSIDSLWGVNSADNIYSGSSASGLNLTSGEKQKIVQEIMEGADFLANVNQSANVSFHYRWNFIQVNATPGPDLSITDKYAKYEDPWRNAAMIKLGYTGSYAGVKKYVQDLKANLNTQWAYAAFFTQYPLNHFAYAGGVRLVMDYDNDGWGPDAINRVFAHETCHIFGAADEYGSCGCGKSGHYAIANRNCVNCTTNQSDCLMDANTLALCKWSQGQIGWSFWDQVSGKLKYISVAKTGAVWGVNASNNIYRRVGNGWQQIPGKLKQISVGSSTKIWGVNASDNIYRRVGNGWQQIPGKLKHISVASDGTVWGVNASNNIYRRVGNGWQQIPGKLKQISVGSSTKIWGVNASDNIYRRVGNGWQQIPGKLKHVSVASDGTVWGVNSSDYIYYRRGSGWVRIAGKLKEISIGSKSKIWGVNVADNIYARRVLATP